MQRKTLYCRFPLHVAAKSTRLPHVTALRASRRLTYYIRSHRNSVCLPTKAATCNGVGLYLQAFQHCCSLSLCAKQANALIRLAVRFAVFRYMWQLIAQYFRKRARNFNYYILCCYRDAFSLLFLLRARTEAAVSPSIRALQHFKWTCSSDV